MATDMTQAVKSWLELQSGDAASRRLLVRKNAQQSLLYLSEKIALGNQRFYTQKSTGDDTLALNPTLDADSHEDAAGGSPLGTGPTAEHFGWRSGYCNITPILAGSRDRPGPPGTGKESPDLALSRLTGLGSQIDRFFTFELTSAQMASLVPKIRLWKIDYKIDAATGEVLRDKPTEDREIIFDSAVTEDEMIMLRGGSPGTDGAGNIGSNGIESFRWELKGVNPAEVDSNIEASLNVYFNNMNVFQKLLDDLHSPSTSTPSPVASFVDLITFAPPTTTTANTLPCPDKFDAKFFEIKVVVGWETSGQNSLFTDEEREYIKDQTVSLFLTLTDHKFDFDEDGSARLEANYRARSSMRAREYDIFYAAPGSAVAEAKKIEQIQKEALETSAAAASTGSTTSTASESAQVAAAEKEVAKAYQSVYKNIIKEILLNVYEVDIPSQLLLNGFEITTASNISIPVPSPGGPGAGITIAKLGEKTEGILTWNQIAKILINKEAGEEVREEVLDPLVTAGTDVTSGVTKINVRRRNFRDKAGFGDIEAAIESATEAVPNAAAPSVEATSIFNKADIGEGGANEVDTINFLYLGDILEIIVQHQPQLLLDIRSKRYAIVTTDFKFINYFKLFSQLTTTNYQQSVGSTRLSGVGCKTDSLSSKARKSLYSTINVANIPINLELFLDFFVSTVVGPGRSTYFMEDFLNDLFNKLVKPVLADPGVLGASPGQPVVMMPTYETSRKRSALLNNKLLGNFTQPSKGAGAKTLTAVANADNRGVIRPKIIFRNQAGEDMEGLSLLGIVKNPTFRDNEEYNYINSAGAYEAVRSRFSQQSIILDPWEHSTPDSTSVKIISVITEMDSYKGDYEKNMEASIKNFVVGLSRGIIKAVSFERVDQPYLRESRTAQAKNFGTGQLRELYHATLVLYGNNLLKPGQMIYIEPNSLIFGRPSDKGSVARVLGLGGYYLVVDVANEISNEGWETRVKALHMAMPSQPEKAATPSITAGA